MLLRFARLAAVALTFIIAARADATQLIYGSYYEDNGFVSCTSTSSCRLDFAQTSATDLTMITRINCASASTVQLTEFTLYVAATTGGTPVGNRFLPLELPAPALVNFVYYYNFQQDLQFLVGQGRVPYVNILNATGGTTSLRCTIVGTPVSP